MRRVIFVFTISAFVLVGCATSFKGVKPLYPKVGLPSVPTSVDSLQPTFRWEPAPESDVTYDLIIYEGIVQGSFWKEGVKRAVGREIYYRKGIKEAEHKIEETLNPDAEYYWSVRKRKGQNVSNWSLYDIEVVGPMGYGKASNCPFLFKTPKK